MFFYKKNSHFSLIIFVGLMIVGAVSFALFFLQKNMSFSASNPQPLSPLASAIVSPKPIVNNSLIPGWSFQKNTFFEVQLPPYLKDNNGGDANAEPLDYAAKQGLADVQFWKRQGGFIIDEQHPENNVPLSTSDCNGVKGEVDHFTIEKDREKKIVIDGFIYTNACGTRKIDALLKQSPSVYWYITSQDLIKDSDFEEIVLSVIFAK